MKPSALTSDAQAAAAAPKRQNHSTSWALTALLSVIFVVAIVTTVLVASSHRIGGHRMDSGLNTWLLLHPPRQVSHDAELLRRRTLAQYVDRPVTELFTHTTAILASMDHSDEHVRRLAGGLLDRLVEAAGQEEGRSELMRSIHPHDVDTLDELLDSDDADVRLHAVQALPRFTSAATLRPHAPRLLELLDDDEDGVRWAAVDAMAALEPAALANHTLAAVDILRRRNEPSLAKVAIAAWADKLDGGGASREVLDAIGQLNYQINFGGGGDGGAAGMGMQL